MMSGTSPDPRGARSAGFRAWRFTAVVCASFILGALGAASPAGAQNAIFMELVGQTGPISALSGTLQAGYTNHTEILQLGGNLYLDSGVPPKLVQRPFRLQKAVDGASPRILEALTNGETITKCVIHYVALNGAATEYLRIDMHDPALVGLAPSASGGGAPGPGTEVVSISYSAIQFVYTPQGP